MSIRDYQDDLKKALEVDLGFPPHVKASAPNCAYGEWPDPPATTYLSVNEVGEGIQFDVIVEFHENGKAECRPSLPVLLSSQFNEGLGHAVQAIRDGLGRTA